MIIVRLLPSCSCFQIEIYFSPFESKQAKIGRHGCKEFKGLSELMLEPDQPASSYRLSLVCQELRFF